MTFMPTTNNAHGWEKLGGDHIWLPYTQMKTAAPPLLAATTRGSRIRLTDGRELIDGVASWWTACHGYNHPHILAAMQAQLEAMPHVMFGGINHEPALRLARRLAGLAGGDLERVFFVDSGSVAVETALKMAAQYWRNRGEPQRVRFVGFRKGYHGDTMGCLSVSDPALGMYPVAEGYRPHQHIADLPVDEATTEAFDSLLKHDHNQIAAVIIEPLVQGVGGMAFHDAATLRRVADICARHHVLLIADEIFTGFGRTGTLFACEHAGVVPDMLCLGKALSACTVTLAAVVARRHVFNAFWSDDPAMAFMHGPTYMANPLACAAANASLDLFESEPRVAEAQKMEAILREGLAPCRDVAGVVDVRAMGAIGVVQFDHALDHRTVRQRFIDMGVWIRSWGDHIYLTPALNIAADDLAALMQAVRRVVGW